MSKNLVFVTVLSAVVAAALFNAAAPCRAVTDYAAMTRRLTIYCQHNPRALHLYEIGRSAASKRPIWLVRVSAAPAGEALTRPFRLLVICRQHGDEPVSTESALALLHQFTVAPAASLRRTLGSTTLYIVPMANPDGADALNRLNGVKADLNRDWGRFTQPETQAVYNAYKMIRPQAVIDMHSWTSGDPFQSNSIEVATPAVVPDPADAKSVALENEIITADQRNGAVVSAFEWAPGCDTTLANRYFATMGNVSMLVETASGWSTTPEMASRMAIDETALRCVLTDIRKDPAGWRRIAAAQHTALAPDNAYTASAASFMPSLSGERDYATKSRTGGWKPLIDRAQVKLLLSTLAAYLAACLVLIRFAGRRAVQSLRLLRQNLSKPKITVMPYVPVYVSVHRRHFPDSPVDIGHRPERRGRFDLRYSLPPNTENTTVSERSPRSTVTKRVA
jgi:hypothetical protein